jgi:hypothetical protein
MQDFRMFCFGLFSGVWNLIANVSVQTECSETFSIELHTAENISKENIRHSNQDESPKSRMQDFL